MTSSSRAQPQQAETNGASREDMGSRPSQVGSFWAQLVGWGKGAESVAKMALLMLGLLYFLGLIVSNEYLAQIGLSDFSLLRIKCILTGVWAVFLLFIGAAPTIFAAFYIQRHGPEMPPTRNIRFVLYCVGIILVAVLLTAEVVKFLAYWPIGSTAMPKAPNLQRQVSNSLLLSGLVLVGPLNWCLVLFFVPSFRRGGVISVLIMWCPLYLVLATSLIARSVYPVIGEEMGGGRARRVTLILNGDGSRFWQQVNEKASYGSAFATTDQVKLLYQNENTIVIQDLDGHILFLDRRLVAGILPVQANRE